MNMTREQYVGGIGEKLNYEVIHMRLNKYAINNEMNRKQYRQLEKKIQDTAKEIIKYVHQTYPERIDNGMYYVVADIIHENTCNEYGLPEDVKCFVIQELKSLGMEFIENNELWRI